MNKNTVGEYYAEYDEESGLYCIFHTDNDEGHAYASKHKAQGVSDNEIIEICKTAKNEADKAGDNWANYVDNALDTAGVETNEAAARALCNEGNMNVVGVLSDGRIIECWDNGTWQIEDKELANASYSSQAEANSAARIKNTPATFDSDSGA